MCEVPEIAGGQSITQIATYDETPYKACHPKRSEGSQHALPETPRLRLGMTSIFARESCHSECSEGFRRRPRRRYDCDRC